MKYTNEQIERAKSASIVEYFQSHGYSCEKVGRDIRVKGFGGLVITDDKMFYWFSQNKGGKGAIECLQTVLGLSFRDAMSQLINELPEHDHEADYSKEKEQSKPVEFQVEKEKKQFVVPEKCENYKRVYAYLINQRHISPALISEFIKQKILFQDVNGNAVFMRYEKNGQACGAELQGTTSDIRFKGITSGSTGCVTYCKGTKPDTAYVFESAIDMMSFVQMHSEIDNAEFVSMAGLKPNVIEQLTERGLRIVSCVDNDEAGCKFNVRLSENCIGLQSILNKQKLNFEMQNVELKDDNKIPIKNVTYAKAEINSKASYFFQNSEDCVAIKDNAELDGRVFIALHSESYFSVNDECAKENVKDFNELLCKKDKITKSHVPEQQTLSDVLATVQEEKAYHTKSPNERSSHEMHI